MHAAKPAYDKLIFELSAPGRFAYSLPDSDVPDSDPAALLPKEHLRASAAELPEVSEVDVIRHYSRLSQMNYGVDTHFYPLGSCTMKYNPKINEDMARLAGFARLHPMAPEAASQGALQLMHELARDLAEISGMDEVSLQPAAGAQGELAGVLMIRAYHLARGERRHKVLIPDSAHGTNPASTALAGFSVVELKSEANGDVDLVDLERHLDEDVAAFMITQPNTLGLFESRIHQITEMCHAKGVQVYMDGANFNAILGITRPGDLGFDVCHFNLHKTFTTPHGGGGPGSGAVGVSARLRPFLPLPIVGKENARYRWLTERDLPQSIGRLSGFMGNAGVNLRAYIYMRLLGREGMVGVAEFAALNANYLMKRLQALGFEAAYPKRRASHEFIITLKQENKAYHVSAMDVAKRLLDYGFHAPTTYFPLLVPECLLIEPTETEAKEDLDRFCDAMASIREEMRHDPEKLASAPHTMPVRRLDDVRAAKQLDLIWKGIAAY
jgi:glycine dehydrogenase subunit 2